MAASGARDRQREFVEAARRAADRYRAEARGAAGGKPFLMPLPGGRVATAEARRGEAKHGEGPVTRRRAG